MGSILKPGKLSTIPIKLLMFDRLYLCYFWTDLQKIGDSWKDLEEIFKMRPIWHFQLNSFKSYNQNKIDCPKNGKIQWPVPHEGKKGDYLKKRPWNFFALICHGLYMCWTTRNRHKSGSSPSLKYTVAIQSSGQRNGRPLCWLFWLGSPPPSAPFFYS